MGPFDAFCKAVTDAVYNATKQDKRAIRRELTEHLEDHAELLMEQGVPEREAIQRSIAAMGDPKEIGRALSQTYPLWPWAVSYLMVAALALLAIAFLAFSLSVPYMVSALQNRSTPENVASPSIPFEDVQRTDYSWEIGTNVLRLYGIREAVEETDYGSDQRVIYLWFCTYNKNPFHTASEFCSSFEFYDANGEELPYGGHGNSNSYLCCWTYAVDVDYYDEYSTYITASLDGFWYPFSVEIPLTEKEVLT